MRKSHRLPSAEPQAPLPQPTMSQMTQVAKECFLLPAKAHWVGEAVMAVPCLALGHFTAWLLQGQQQKGLGRWMRLIAISQVALVQEAFLTYQAGTGPASGTTPVIPTHLGLGLPTTDLRAEGTWPELV